MKFKVIASGSKGNMTYIETDEAKILVDVGISMREASRRTDIDFDDIDAIIITHEHGDHTKFLRTIAKKTNAIVYIHKATLESYFNREHQEFNLKVKYIEPNMEYDIKDLKFETLKLSHDVPCLGFIFHHGDKSLGYITDTGFLPLPYIEKLRAVDSLVIESNHDVEMLYNSERDWRLKERIYSVKGHMSNYICGQILNTVVQDQRIRNVVLAHLSEECNNEEIAVDTILELIEGDYIPSILIAKQDVSMKLIEV